MKGLSLLLTLPTSFDIIKGEVPDFMNRILLGVVEALLLLWFDPSEHQKYFQNNKTYPQFFIGHNVSCQIFTFLLFVA